MTFGATEAKMKWGLKVLISGRFALVYHLFCLFYHMVHHVCSLFVFWCDAG